MWKAKMNISTYTSYVGIEEDKANFESKDHEIDMDSYKNMFSWVNTKKYLKEQRNMIELVKKSRNSWLSTQRGYTVNS